MATSPQDIQVQLEQLRQDYQTSLQQQWPDLMAELRQLMQPSLEDWQATALSLKQHFHTLAGSAGTFGMHQLGQQAKALELELTSWLEAKQRPETEQCQHLLEMMEEISLQTSTSTPEATTSFQQQFKDEQEQKALIYMLEDDEQTGEQLRLTLATFGHEVRWYKACSELQQAFEQKMPDIFVLDLACPIKHQHGCGLIKEYELDSASARTALFVIGEKDGFDDYLAAVRMGAKGYFVKPINAGALEARVQRMLLQRLQAPFRVLIVDDDVMLAQHYKLVIEQAGLVAEVLTEPGQVFKGLKSFQPDVILLDVNMPDCSGPELAQLIRFQDEWLGVPIIYLSSETDSQRQLDALVKAGDDFLSKPITDQALAVTVFARAQRARQLAEMMTRDSLTGLLQHANIKDRLSDEIAKASRSREPLVVVMLDIDHFKRVNDEHGHLMGDQVITSLANLLKQQLRKSDLVGRYGGEEFLLGLPDCPPEKAHKIVDAIRQKFKQLPFTGDKSSFNCTFSAGIALVNSKLSTDENIDRADQAMYQAKEQGRNRVVLADN
ncbi:MAG: diguanylate cyclase [Alkalimonas sp.]|nr:diguanylate cyclase [Alkalimonas sp.]